MAAVPLKLTPYNCPGLFGRQPATVRSNEHVIRSRHQPNGRSHPVIQASPRGEMPSARPMPESHLPPAPSIGSRPITPRKEPRTHPGTRQAIRSGTALAGAGDISLPGLAPWN